MRLALILIAGTVTVGCGSSASTANPATSSPSTAAPATSTPGSTVPATTVSDQCTSGDLHPSWTGQRNGASGHLLYSVNLLNSSSSACVTGGYVGVSAYDPAGNPIAASGARDAMGTSSPPTLTVAPGATVHFVVSLPYGTEGTGGTACSTSVGALHLIPPNETTVVQIATPIRTGYPKLCGNTFLVGPLLGGAGV
jgi:hypothetical protein